jgi:hypothetical protein
LNSALQDRAAKQKQVEIAVTVLQSPKSDDLPALKSWAFEKVNEALDLPPEARLELQTSRLPAPPAITSLDNSIISVDPKKIARISGPYPHDVGPHTYVNLTDPGRDVLITSESPEALIDRLNLSGALAKLTRPDSQPVWINGASVDLVRPPLPAEAQLNENAVVSMNNNVFHQGIREDVATAKNIINAHGGHLPP